ncbi:trigger factor [Oscillatoria sp. CS-180]|uniref:trigger factor n=1 Tax=Oscillatoria sp. CS-180 TaxID=3021720 RepID=UPI00232F09BF|nr:trigger factor [Oscillatoria sp. CS-180]MDB9524453.1 trigger factor [Oscillatoria sp. CS-180]
MKVTQEKLPDSQLGLQIEIPAEVSKKTYEKVLQKLIKTVRVPGFRPGKVPRQVFLQRFGPTQIKAAALEELVQDSIEQAIKQESIDTIGNYQLVSEFEELIEQYTPGEVLTVKASVDVPPRVKLETYTGLTVQAEEVEYAESKVNEVLEQYRLNLATLVPIEDRAAKMGDVAVIDFEGKIKQEDDTYEVFEGGTAEDFQLELKEGGFIDGFVEGIVGMSLDETKELSLTFPENYPQQDLAGKPTLFTVTLQDLKEKELPDLDDDFAEEVSEFETLAELRTSLEERYQTEAADETESNQFEALLEELLKHLDAEIPETLIRREANYLVQQTAVQLSRQGIDINKMLTPEIVENMRDRARPDAIDRLRRTLALGEVAKQESISIEEDAIKARMDEMLEEVSNPEDIDRDRLREVVNEELLQEKILKWLLENNTVDLVPEGTLKPDESDEADDAETSASTEVLDVSATEVEEVPENAEALATEAVATAADADEASADEMAEAKAAVEAVEASSGSEEE